jgi:hypothetical protein
LSWQDEWVNTMGNKLCLVKPSVQAWHSTFCAVRKEEVTLTRLHIGHMCLTHGHLLCGELALVLTVVSHLLWHTFLWTAHTMVKPATYIIFTAHYPTFLVMIATAFPLFWLL